MASTLLIAGLDSPLLVTEGLAGSALTGGSALIIEGLNSPQLLIWGLGSSGVTPPVGLTVFPDPFASTAFVTVDPFGSTARLKGN